MANGEIRGFFKINNGDLVEPYLSVSKVFFISYFKVLYNHKEA
jgi:hypothetical protein